MKPINLTSANYDEVVNNSEKKVLIDFYANWCGPCKMIAPIINELAEEVSHAKICKVNVDEESELAAKFGIMSIPTILVIEKNKIVNKGVGLQSKEALLRLIG
jgi:thioredoxin 1